MIIKFEIKLSNRFKWSSIPAGKVFRAVKTGNVNGTQLVTLVGPWAQQTQQTLPFSGLPAKVPRAVFTRVL